MSTADVIRLASESGADTSTVFAATEPDVVPSAPSPSWVLVPRSDGRTTLGGMDRGTFRVYDTYETDELAANAVLHVLTPMRPDVDPAALPEHRARARALAAGLQARVAEGQQLVPAAIRVDTALDHVGLPSGHTLFLLDTPFAQRSSPPTDLQLPRTAFVLRAPLGPDVAVSAVRPWFGQPGGGIMVTLDRPVRWYYDTRILDILPLEAPTST